MSKAPAGISVFEKYLSVWVILCIFAGILFGRIAPGFAEALDGMRAHRMKYFLPNRRPHLYRQITKKEQ